MAEAKLTSLTYEDARFKLSLSGEAHKSTAAPKVDVGAVFAESTHAREREPIAADDSVRLVTVTAPIVGTVWRAREPGKSPLVSFGDTVRAGEALCVIEAMKMFSDIVSPCDGIVAKIAFEDGALAGYGDSLVVIELAPEGGAR
jgi:acetyl-CoA carboxylase biotin carboxyl carrier protein